MCMFIFRCIQLYRKSRARKMSKSLVALQAVTLQVLVAWKWTELAQIKKDHKCQSKTFSIHKYKRISMKEFYFIIYRVSAKIKINQFKAIYASLMKVMWHTAKYGDPYSCSAFTYPSAHTQQWTHTHTHTVSTHPGPEGSHLWCGARGAVPCSRAPQSWYWRWREHCTFTPHPPTIHAVPRFELATFRLRVWSLPLGHDLRAAQVKWTLCEWGWTIYMVTY